MNDKMIEDLNQDTVDVYRMYEELVRESLVGLRKLNVKLKELSDKWQERWLEHQTSATHQAWRAIHVNYLANEKRILKEESDLISYKEMREGFERTLAETKKQVGTLDPFLLLASKKDDSGEVN